MVLGEMKVKRVHEGNQSWYEPSLDLEWSELTQLRWLAACIELDHGIKITVRPGGLWSDGFPVFDVFNISYLNGGSSPFTFETLWDYLHGVSIGAHIMRGTLQRAAEPVYAQVYRAMDYPINIEDIRDTKTGRLGKKWAEADHAVFMGLSSSASFFEDLFKGRD